jgi:hypothetical protein
MEKKTIYQALLEAQKEFPTIKKEDKNPFFKSTYAGLPSILEVVLPILHKHGIVLTQFPVSEEGRIGVTTRLANANECLDSTFTLPLAQNTPQGAGSAITYARRYALVSMLGLNVDDDDDGNEASKKGKDEPEGFEEPTIRR